MLRNNINPEILLNLKAFKQSSALCLLNFLIWKIKLKIKNINSIVKIFIFSISLNRYINIKEVNK